MISHHMFSELYLPSFFNCFQTNLVEYISVELGNVFPFFFSNVCFNWLDVDSMGLESKTYGEQLAELNLS